MNYEKIYNDLIERSFFQCREKRKRDNSNYIYYERHHILPRCLNGKNSNDNLVLLTAREHFIAHKLLVEIYPDNKKLEHVLWMFVNKMSSKGQEREYNIGSREYERIRDLHSKIMSITSKSRKGKYKASEETKEKLRQYRIGKKHSEETKAKMRKQRPNFTGKNNPNFGRESQLKGKKHTEEALKNIKANQPDRSGRNNSMYGKTSAMKGKTHSIEAREKCRIANTGKIRSQETRDKISKSWECRNDYECEYCGFITKSKMNYIKYHSDNCKKNPDRNLMIYRCKYCSLETENKGNFNRYHNNNCKFKTNESK